MMAHIEMKAMEKFPIEKLSYDLKLELLENMNPRDIVKLVNVNQGFRSIVVREPWRIFGRHVEGIRIGKDHGSVPNIRKFGSLLSADDDKPSIRLSGSNRYHLMEGKTYLNLISRIRSCQKLELDMSSEDDEQEEDQLGFVELLTNLCSVGELDIWFEDTPHSENLTKYLTCLTLNHIKKAILGIGCSEISEQMLGVLSNFVETSLNHCKRIGIDDSSSHCHFWYEPLSKVSTEMIFLGLECLDDKDLVHRIVTKGIPSSNPKAAILLNYGLGIRPAINSINSLLSRTPGVSEIALEDRGEIEEFLKELLLDEHYLISCDDVEILRKGAYFTRSIDSNRKCIYVTEPTDSFFFAKYITIG